ncbi:hypothetical protein KDA_07320 [Dictyobacter alpinus]|uniref:Uncharacterized protein n=2 Tax=Dictyobacter alpinus TaxID=2014873 RepID=A0A402B1N9_9CHLR|nr:hypothetical protein KDA_07320 [Dictyobacter alpinus]
MEATPPGEGQQLGERNQLGSLEAAYYVVYTQKDIRRYRIQALILSAALVYMLLNIIYIVLMALNLFHFFSYYSFYPLPTIILPLVIAYSTSTRRKWGNWPVISPRNRQQRVYLYRDGLIKQIHGRSQIVRWPEIFQISYQPWQAGDDQSFRPVPTARIKLMLHGGHHVHLNGALSNIDDLAYRLNAIVPRSYARFQ